MPPLAIEQCTVHRIPRIRPAWRRMLSDKTAAVMVGDAVLDMQMAANAGADSVAVSYGASPRERLLETASLGVADNVPQLAAILGLEKYLA